MTEPDSSEEGAKRSMYKDYSIYYLMRNNSDEIDQNNKGGKILRRNSFQRTLAGENFSRLLFVPGRTYMSPVNDAIPEPYVWSVRLEKIPTSVPF